MFCPNCGEELLDNNQNFCHKCGHKIDIITSKVPRYEPERIQNVAPPQIYYTPPKQQYPQAKPQFQRGAIGKYSKTCLGLALVSLLIGIITFIIGYNVYRLMYAYYPPSGYGRIGGLIIILLLRIAGLIMGIFAKVNGVKAERFEPFNEAEKAGSTIVIFAILINALGIFLSLFGPLSISYIPYY